MQPAIRRLELKSTVRSLIVVMVDVFVQYPFEVTAATNDQPVQAFASSTANPALVSGSKMTSRGRRHIAIVA